LAVAPTSIVYEILFLSSSKPEKIFQHLEPS